jgi:MFS family permease
VEAAPESPAPEAAPPRPADGGRLGVLQLRDFRLLWIGFIIAHTGSWMQQVTSNWLLWELTHSPLAIGTMGLFRSIPFILISLYAGALADRMDRRYLLMITNAINALFPLALGVIAMVGHIEPWHLYASAALSAVVDSFDLPARQSLIPAIVPRAQLMSALGLTNSLRRATSLIGPSLGGLAVWAVGAAGAFYLNALGFMAVFAAAALMHTRVGRPPPTSTSALAMVREGLGYVLHHRLLGTLMGVEALVTLCTAYQSMVTVFAESILDVGPAGLGLLMSAPGVGAILASVGMVSLGQVSSTGRLMLVSGALYGVALVGFAVSRWFPLSLLMMAAVGFLDTLYGTSRSTIVQLAVTDRFRGRVMSLNSMTQRGLGPSGNFVSGSLATVVGAPAAMVILALFATGISIWRGLAFPALRDFRDT